MPGLFQKARRFASGRPGLTCLFWGTVLLIISVLGAFLKETPLDEKRSGRERRALHAVESSLLNWRDGVAYLEGETEPFGGWEKENLTIEGYAGEIPVRLFIPYRNGKREGHGEGFYGDKRHFSDTWYGSVGHRETTFYHSGQLRSHSSDHRLINGTSRYFHDKPSPNGQKKFEGVWEDGVLVSEKWWNREGLETSSNKIPVR